MKPRFITFEGIDGAGKSVQIELLANRLKNNSIPNLVTREPGGTDLGESIRKVLLDSSCTISSLTELLLMFASRVQHVSEVIGNALCDDMWVICDRFYDATYAYQGWGRGLSIDTINSLHELCTNSIEPDLTFLIDISVQESIDRTQKRNSKQDKFDYLDSDFKERVRQGYIDRANSDPDRIKVINGDQSVELVHEAIWKSIYKFYIQ